MLDDPVTVLQIVGFAVFFSVLLGIRASQRELTERRPTHRGPLPDEIVADEVRVIDGDTVRVLYDGGWVPVRLCGIDAPELAQRTLPVSFMRTRIAIGERSRAALVELVRGRSVSCALYGADRYGRALGVLSTDRVHDVGGELVRRGWAVAYERYGGELYLGAQAEARAASRGMWAWDGAWLNPETWRRVYR
jgi:endonuclease YncB( thermonuclease family)